MNEICIHIFCYAIGLKVKDMQILTKVPISCKTVDNRSAGSVSFNTVSFLLGSLGHVRSLDRRARQVGIDWLLQNIKRFLTNYHRQPLSCHVAFIINLLQCIFTLTKIYKR